MSNELLAKKLTDNNIFDCNLEKFISTITEILPFSGVGLSKFYSCEYDGLQFLTKLGFYRKTPMELYGKKSKHLIPVTETEIMILIAFKENILHKNLTPCILELILAHTCTDTLAANNTITDCTDPNTKDFIRNNVNEVMCKYTDLVKEGLAQNKFSRIVLERCEITLRTYIASIMMTPASNVIFKTMLFMIIHARYMISLVYPKFFHRDLHAENIMIKFDFQFKFSILNPKFLVFTVGDDRYYIPYFGIIPKIIDFGHSSLPEIGGESIMQDSLEFIYQRTDHDLLILFHYIYHLVNKQMGKDIIDLLKLLEPNESYIKYYTPYIKEISSKIPSYQDMVTNHTWDEYKNLKVAPNQIYAEYDQPKH